MSPHAFGSEQLVWQEAPLPGCSPPEGLGLGRLSLPTADVQENLQSPKNFLKKGRMKKKNPEGIYNANWTIYERLKKG